MRMPVIRHRPRAQYPQRLDPYAAQFIKVSAQHLLQRPNAATASMVRRNQTRRR